jgi:small GTP-binding protein
MGEIQVKSIYAGNLDELIVLNRDFEFLKRVTIPKNKKYEWKIGDKTVQDIQVMFIGKTGYGKSTTLNKLCGKRLFETDDVRSCTKILQEARYKIHAESTDCNYFSFCDLPGVGESETSDTVYCNQYRQMIRKSHCVVYLLNIDKRDLAIDEKVIGEVLRKYDATLHKVLFAINQVDKVEPLSRTRPFVPTTSQWKTISAIMQKFSERLKLNPNKLVFYSALEGYNLGKLLSNILTIVHEQLYQ